MKLYAKIFGTAGLALCLPLSSMSCKEASTMMFLPLGGGAAGALVSAAAKMINAATEATHWLGERSVAYNNAGYGLAVWTSNSGADSENLFSVFNPSTNKWSPPRVILKDCGNPQVASNGTTFMIAFTTYNGIICVKTWNGRSLSDPVAVSDSNQCSYPYVFSNGAGYCVVWQQYDTDCYNLHASVYNGTSWGTQTAIETTVGSPNSVRIASSGAGYCVTWYDNGTDRVYASVYTSSWTAPDEMGNGSSINGNYQVAGDGADNYMIVFGHSDSIYGALYNGTSWGAPVEIDDTGAGMNVAYGPAIASNGTTFCAVWYQHDGSYYSIYSRIFTTSWQAITPLESLASTAYLPKIASDGSGYAVSWYQNDGGVYKAFANRYTTSWQGAVVLNPSSTTDTDPSYIYSNGTGYMASWREFNASTPFGNDYYLYSSAFDGSAWSAPALVDTRPLINVSPAIYSYPRGYFCWYTYYRDDFTNIMTARYQNDEWKDPITPATGRVGSCQSPMQNGQPYLYRAGTDTVAVWRQFDNYSNGIYQLYASVKSGSTWGEPLLLERNLGGNTYHAASNGTSVCIVWYYNDSTKSRAVIKARIYSNGSWADAADIDNDVNGLNSFAPLVAANAATNDFCVIWHQHGGGLYYRTYAAIHNTATGWGGPAQIDNNAAFDTYTRHLTAGGDSRYCALFYEDGHTYAAIYNGSSWTTPEQIHANDFYPDRYTMAGSGDNFAVMYSDSGDVSSKLHDGLSWSGWEVRDLVPGDYSYGPGVTGDGNGNFCAVWTENITGGYRIMASIYDDSGPSWGTPENAEAPGLFDYINYSYDAKVTSNGTGYAVVFYMQDIYNVNRPYASVYDGVSWLGLEQLDTSAIPLTGSYYEIASNGNGYGVIWWQYNTDATWMLYGSSYDGESWTGRPLSNGKSNIYTYSPNIIGSGTSYTAGWLQYDEDDDTVMNLWSNTFR